MARRGALGLIASGLGALLGSCSLSRVAIRYRLLVEVETPEGLKTGSGVWQATIERNYAPGYAVMLRYRGEAIAVDLSEGPIFALLRSEDDVEFAANLINRRAGEVGRAQGIPDQDWHAQWVALRRDRRRWMLPQRIDDLYFGSSRRSGYPWLVEFADLSDPGSVRQVDPNGFRNGCRVSRIVAEITTDPISVEILRRLTWLPTHRNIKLSGNRRSFSNHIADILSAGWFSTELPR